MIISTSLDNSPNQPYKFATKAQVEKHDGSYGASSSDSQIRFKTSMMMESL